MDGSLHTALCGGEGTGPNPTDRPKSGWKWSTATDRVGVPIGWTIEGPQPQRLHPLEPTLDDVAKRGLPTDIETLHLDKGYDSELTISCCTGRGITGVVVAKKGRKKKTPTKTGTPHPRHALARRTHKQLVLKLRSTPPQHRPTHHPAPRTDRTRRQAVGLVHDGRTRAPRIHDLRHRMVVRRIQTWHAEGVNVDANIAVLATYLGHIEVRDLYWDLSAVPELMGIVAARFEAFAECAPGGVS